MATLNSVLWSPGQIPFTRAVTWPPSAVSAANIPKLPLLCRITCGHRGPAPPPPNSHRNTTGLSQGTRTLQWVYIPTGPPPVLGQARFALSLLLPIMHFLVYNERIPLGLSGKHTWPIKLSNLSFIGKLCIVYSTLGPSLSNSGFIAAHLQLCKSWLTDSNTNSFRPREVEVNSVQGRDAPPSDGKAGFCIHLHLHFDILNLPINGPVYLDSPLIEL